MASVPARSGQPPGVPVAQLDKAPDYELGDWGFKSLQEYVFVSANGGALILLARGARLSGGGVRKKKRMRVVTHTICP